MSARTQYHNTTQKRRLDLTKTTGIRGRKVSECWYALEVLVTGWRCLGGPFIALGAYEPLPPLNGCWKTFLYGCTKPSDGASNSTVSHQTVHSNGLQILWLESFLSWVAPDQPGAPPSRPVMSASRWRPNEGRSTQWRSGPVRTRPSVIHSLVIFKEKSWDRAVWPGSHGPSPVHHRTV